MNFNTKNNVNAITTADLNNDGNVDLVTGCGYIYNPQSPACVAILLGNGAGMFTLTDTFVVAGGPVSITCANLNSDGFVDLATATYTTSTTLSVIISCGTSSVTAGINAQLQKEIEYSIYPNPTDNGIYIERKNDEEKMEFKIADIIGNEVLVNSYNEKGKLFINVNHLSTGIYFIKIKTAEGMSTRKFIVQH